MIASLFDGEATDLALVLGYPQVPVSVKRSRKLAHLPDIRLLGLD